MKKKDAFRPTKYNVDPEQLSSRVNPADLFIGLQIAHPLFGSAVVTSFTTQVVTAVFDGGTLRTFKIDIAPLRKLPTFKDVCLPTL